jgi:hypothetical protein
MKVIEDLLFAEFDSFTAYFLTVTRNPIDQGERHFLLDPAPIMRTADLDSALKQFLPDRLRTEPE